MFGPSPFDQQQQQPNGDYTRLWAESLGSSIFELFGANASDEVNRWREQHPLGGLTSQGAGVLVPYGGWYKAAKTVGTLNRMTSLPRQMQHNRPLLSAALQEPVRFAPLEAARMASAAFVEGGDNFVNTAGSVGVNVALGGALGTGVGLFRQAGRTLRNFNDYTSGKAPAALQWRQFRRDIEEGKLTDWPEGDVAFAHKRFEEMVLTEDVLAGVRDKGKRQYLRMLDDADEKVTGQVNALFNPHGNRSRTNWHSLSLMPGGGMTAELQHKALRLGGIEQRLHDVQFPRFVASKNAEGKKYLESLIYGRDGKKTGFLRVDKTTLMRRETDDGLFVVAKEIEDDGWLLFKTDAPEVVSEGAQMVGNAIAKQSDFWFPHINTGQKIGVEFHDTLFNMRQLMDDNVLDALGTPSTPIVQALSKSQFAQQVWFALKKYFAPSTFQVDTALGRKARGLMELGHDLGVGRASQIWYGNYGAAKGVNLLKSIRTNVPEGYRGLPPLQKVVQGLDDRDISGVHQAWMKRMSPEALDQAVRRGEISGKAGAAVKAMNQYDDMLWTELKQTGTALGIDIPDPLKGHLMVSRTWQGNHRVEVMAAAKDGSTSTVWMASGTTREQALKEADAVVTRLRAEGKESSVGRAFVSSSEQDMARLLDPARAEFGQLMTADNPYTDIAMNAAMEVRKTGKPGFMQERKGMRGFIGDAAPFTQQELGDILQNHIFQQQRFMAELSTKNIIQPLLQRLQDQGKLTEVSLLRDQMERMFGNAGVVSEVINSTVDTVLGSSLGKNSANKITAALNNLLFNFSLGAGNMTYPAINALTFTQTVMPQAAFLMRAPMGDLRKVFSTLPASDTRGNIRGGMGMLDTMKVTGRGFEILGNPTEVQARVMSRMLNDGTLRPVMMEEFVGQKSKLRKTIGDGLQEMMSGDAVQGLQTLSEWAPQYSELFARGHSAGVGFSIAQDVFGMTDETQIYQFVREFVNSTMFRYGQGDRAKLLTGPVGSALGLFKNWMFHQTGFMLKYAGIGLRDLHKGDLTGFTPLLMLAAGTGAVGGTAAMPGAFMLDWISRLDDNKTFQLHLYNWLAGTDGDTTLADSVYYGLPSLMGISLQASASAPFSDPVRDASMVFSAVATQRAQALGQAIGGAVERGSIVGGMPGESERVRDALVRFAAPRSIQRWFQTFEGDYIRSLHTGHPNVSVTGTERMLYNMGFNPVAVDRAYAVQRELWADQQRMRDSVQEFGRAIAEAQTASDWRETNDLVRRAVARGIPVDSVLRSAEARRNKGAQETLVRQFEPEAVGRFQSVLGNSYPY